MITTRMDRTRQGGAVAALCALALALPGSLGAQEHPSARTDSLVRAGDLAARDSRHPAAIDAYERAIALEPGRRLALLPALGRQYLWSDQARRAAALFTEYLAARPESCETRLDLGLAWSWADALDAARATYDDVAARCLYERGPARLGAARALRWGNRFSAAERRYHEVLADGSDGDREQAAIGLAYVRLARGEPRAALALADSLIAVGSRDPSLTEARVMALADLGALGSAVHAARAAREDGRGSASLDRLTRGYEERGRASFVAGARGFRDRDGTSYRAADVASAAAPLGFGTVRLTGRAAELRGESVSLRSREAEASLDLRPTRALAIAARGGVRAYDLDDFTPWDGELNLAWLPGDRHRVDLAAARLLVGDNLPAIQERLVGTFASAGLTERLTTRLTAAVSVDATRWSEGNTRVRLRATPQYRFDGVPVVTVDWPTVYQRYDVPFDFRFFSPSSYVETGPGLTVNRRVARAWYLSGSARGGALRESGQAWQPLGVARASVERELRAHWGVRVEGGWSNSNLAGSTGFQRTMLGASLTIRP
jgi:tetratricopeptide (TPR) repeat protein